MYCGTEETGLQFNGDASVTVTDCNVAVNSRNDPSILFNGGGNCSGIGEQDLIVNGGIVAYGGDEDAQGTLINNGSSYCIDCPECPVNVDGLHEAVPNMNWVADPYCNMQPTDCNAVPPTYAAAYPAGCYYYDEDGEYVSFGDPEYPSVQTVPPTIFTLPILNGGNTTAPGTFPDCATVMGGAADPEEPCIDTGNSVLQLPEGYYTQPQGIRINGGSVNLQCDPLSTQGCLFFVDRLWINSGDLTGTNVTVYATNVLEGQGNNLAFDLGGNATLNLCAPTASTSAYQNMLLFNSREGSMGCNVRGDSDSTLKGTIYCPTGFLDYGGNSTFDLTADNAAVIGYQIQFHGNPEVGVTSLLDGGAGGTIQFSEIKMVE